MPVRPTAPSFAAGQPTHILPYNNTPRQIDRIVSNSSNARDTNSGPRTVPTDQSDHHRMRQRPETSMAQGYSPANIPGHNPPQAQYQPTPIQAPSRVPTTPRPPHNSPRRPDIPRLAPSTPRSPYRAATTRRYQDAATQTENAGCKERNPGRNTQGPRPSTSTQTSNDMKEKAPLTRKVFEKLLDRKLSTFKKDMTKLMRELKASSSSSSSSANSTASNSSDEE